MVCINDLDEQGGERGGREPSENQKKRGRGGGEKQKRQSLCHVYTRHRSLDDTPHVYSIFNELSLSLDYRTRGFDVVMGSNESIDNVDELMTLVIQRQSSSPTLRWCRLDSLVFVSYRSLSQPLSLHFSHPRPVPLTPLSLSLFVSLSLSVFF